jgi:ABC-type glycerol-3-phosphate transport system permease component
VSGRETPTRRLGRGLRAALALAVLVPLVWMVAASLKPDAAIHQHVDSVRGLIPDPLTTENYVDAWRRGGLAVALVNTLIVVALVGGLGVVVNGAAAFALARMRFPGRELLFALLVASIILPLEVIVIPLFVTVRASAPLMDVLGERGWTLAVLTVPFVAKGFNIFLLRQYFLSMPRALEEAALLDGAGWWTVFWRIALPNAKPVLVTVVVLDFVVHWNDFLWPLVICQGETTRTVQLGLGNFFTQPPVAWGAIMAYAVLITIPLALVFIVGQRWVVASTMSSGIRE